MSKIQVVWFRDLQTWSVALQNTQKISSKFSLAMLREVLIDLTKTRIFVIDDNKFYQEPTISSKTNLITARKQGLGKEFKVKKRVLILPNDLVIAKMHTQNGLYAFAKESFASTTTFAPFEIVESKINKDYLFIILKMTLQRLQKFDSVKRETYTTDEILDLQIPLPPLEIQNKIVADIHAVQNKIKALQEEEKRLKDEIEAYIYITLGLQKPQNTAKQKVFVVRFKDLERWDISYNQNIYKQESKNTKIDTYLLQELCDINPSVDMKELIKQDKNVSFIPMEVLENNGKSFAPISKKASLHKGFTKFQNDDLLWAKITPCMQNKKSVVVSGLENGVGFGSTEFFVLRAKDSHKTDIHFILQILRTDLVIEQAKLHFKGSAGQQRVPKDFLENLQIPLPPLDTQKEMVAHIEQKTSHIQKLAQERIALRNSIESKLQEMLMD